MTQILTEAAWWLLQAQVNAAAWLTVSIFVGSLWALENWRFRR